MKSDPRRKDDEEVRCECGHLLAKMTAEGLEVKCRKCKRVHLLRVSAVGAARSRGAALKVPKLAKPGNEQN
jgi:phage FluMu protein Com